MTQRFRNCRTAATLVASCALCASAIVLAADTPGEKPRSSKPQQVQDKNARKDKGPSSKTPTVGDNRRIKLAPPTTRTKDNNPSIRAQRELVADAEAAFQVDPVTGVGMLLSPDGVPVFVNLRHSSGSGAWVGKALGDEDSFAFVVSTRWGHVGTLWSKVWGSFRFLPNDVGQAMIRSSNVRKNGVCGNGSEWEIPLPDFMLNEGGLAGSNIFPGGECWLDTDDQTEPDPDTGLSVPLWLGGDPKDPGGKSVSWSKENGLCTGPDVSTTGPDIPDFSVRDPNCDGFTTIDRVVDILYGYSKDAENCVGGVAAVHALAVAEIALLNECFWRSEMRVKARLVGIELGLQGYTPSGAPIPHYGSSSPPGDLNRLIAAYFPQYAGLENIMHDLRDERGADLVTYLVCNNATGVLGIAANIPMQENGSTNSIDTHLAGAVMTVEANLSLTYQHEIGHLLGGCHGHPNADIEGAGEATCPCPDGGDECALIPVAFGGPYLQPDEYHYGLRFEEEFDEAPPTDRILQSVMAYDAADQESFRVPYFANPLVEVEGTNSPTGVEDENGDCCQDDGESAANALVMDWYIFGLTSLPSPPYTNIFPGISQYRCKTIPYDCNQNGLLDTEELDGLHANVDQLTDYDGDRVADGCLPRDCFLDATTGDTLTGSGGVIGDWGVVESAVAIPYGNTDDVWAYQPLEIRINGLTHTNLDDLQIKLIHRQFGGQETSWNLVDCAGTLSAAAARILNGTYLFVTPTDPNGFDFLETDSVCQVAERGGIGGALIPSGTYRSQQSLMTQMDRRPLSGSWVLQITDLGAGDQGSFTSWTLQFAVVTYADDCNGNGEPDNCESSFSLATDCNQNNQADACEIAAMPILDCDLNGKPDECDDLSHLWDCGGPAVYDYDLDGDVDAEDATALAMDCPTFGQGGPNCRPDLCDILDDPNIDLNGNYVIDVCEIAGDCGQARIDPGCSDINCETAVCNYDPDGDGTADFAYCCETSWDSGCVSIADELCGGGIGCGNRIYNSLTRDNSGPGISFSDLGMVESSIYIPVEPDDFTSEPVVAGAIVKGSFEVTISGFDHAAVPEMAIRLRHTSNGVTTTVPLIEIGCSGGIGYPAGGDFTFKDLGVVRTFCEQSQYQGGPVNPALDYRADGALSAFIGHVASGTWTLELYDIGAGETGSIDSWDLRFVHVPPDADANGVPDICE